MITLDSRSKWTRGLGLALLYASGYYLPIVGNYYFGYEAAQILYPTAVATLVLLPLGAWCHSRYAIAMRRDFMGLIVISVLSLIAMVSAFSAAGYSAFGIAVAITGSQNDPGMTRWIRVAMVIAGSTTLLTAIYCWRRRWREVLRLLSILGYLYATLGLARVDYGNWHASAQPDAPIVKPGLEKGAPQPPRRVVWIILDELDYNKTLGARDARDSSMPNLERLASLGVSASNAYSPAKDTVASIPALLTGYQLTGLDIKGTEMRLRTGSGNEAELRPFTEANSIFDRLPAGPNSAAILGFYHPYCSLFRSVKDCRASPEANVGRWYDGLIFFSQTALDAARSIPAVDQLLPNKLFELFEPWYRISAQTISELPSFLSLQNKSLIYIHVNLPHLPGDYSRRLFQSKAGGDDQETYLRNLKLADKIVADTVAILEAGSDQQDTLLIISSDHWQRIESPLLAQRIPWVAWHVGERDSTRLESKINTGQTADLIAAFLRGEIRNQPQVAAWWDRQTFYPPLMPHGFEY